MFLRSTDRVQPDVPTQTADGFPDSASTTQVRLVAAAVLALAFSLLAFLAIDAVAGAGTLLATGGLIAAVLGGQRRRAWLVGAGIVVAGGFALLAVGIVNGHPKSQTAPKPALSPSAPPLGSSSPTVRASVTLEQQKEQVRQALLRYWDAYALAEKTLDPTALGSVAAGQVLEYSQASVQHDRSINQPWLLRADHTITSIVVTPGLGGPNLGAQVDESYVDHSVRLDPRTLQPLEADPNRNGKDSYTLQEVTEGQWKVVSSTEIN